MQVLVKNGMKFVIDMFWQIPDMGKKTVSFAQIIKYTKNNMYCQIDKSVLSNPQFKLTYGFCNKNILLKDKKAACLAKFILRASNLNFEYTNIIICYKFGDSRELDNIDASQLVDMFGYLIILNGTVCPNEGESIASLDVIKQAVIDKARVYEIDTLFLPVDVAIAFMSIYERLDNAIYDDELLFYILNTATKNELAALTDCAQDVSNINLIDIIKHENFHNRVKDNITIEHSFRYLIPNIIQVQSSSDEIYWKNDKFKQNYNKALIYPLSKRLVKRYTLIVLLIIFLLGSYAIHNLQTNNSLLLNKPINRKLSILNVVPLVPEQLINLCFTNSDRFFKDLRHWTFSSLKCNSLGVSYIFSSDTDTTISEFANLVGDNKNITLSRRRGNYQRKFIIANPVKQKLRWSKIEIINNLQQGAIDYQFKLTIPANHNIKTKYSISSTTSPIFLLNHGVFSGVMVSEISMVFDKGSGSYHWTVQGEF